MINDNEETFEKKLNMESWYINNKNLDITKLKKNISLKYFLTEDKKLEAYCTEKIFQHVMSKKILSESQNCKDLCRAGVPIKYMKDLYIKMFNTNVSEDSFNDKFKLVFKDYDANHIHEFVPYFTGFKTLQESLPVDYLNEDGIQKLKEILWLLNSVIPVIEFSPLIIKLTSILLIFCNQVETYYIMRSLLELSYNLNDTSMIRWHVRFSYNDNYKIITSAAESLKTISNTGKELYQHFENINFPIEKLLEDMIYGFFLEYLNLSGILRLLPLFMNEGVKVLYRLTYALLKTIKPSIMKITSPDNAISTIKKLSREVTDMKALFTLAFSYKLNRNNNKYEFQKLPDIDLFANKRNSFYLPKFTRTSTILEQIDIFQVWGKLPLDLKIKDAEMIYSTNKDGFSLSTIYSLANNYEDTQIIMFLIETFNGEKFGGIMSQMFKKTNMQFVKPFQSYLISLKPNFGFYEENKTNDNIFYGDSEWFMFINGKAGPAIQIKNDLSKGFTHENDFYDSPAFVKDNEFQIKCFEIFILF
jgi:hypothetical protein